MAKQIDLRYNKEGISEDQAHCFKMLCDVVGGEHHLTGPVYAIGDYAIKASLFDSWATYDSSFLTYLVVLAHDRCVRVEIQSSSPKYLKFVISKRERKSKDTYNSHPTMEEAIETIRERYPKTSD